MIYVVFLCEWCVQFFLDTAENVGYSDQNVEQKISFLHTHGCFIPSAYYHVSSMGKLPDIQPNILMLYYYLQRVLCQFMGYVASLTREYKPL